MLNELQTTIGQIAVFMICSQAIAHFRARESYAKYLRMLLGVMILVQIFQPFYKLFWGVTAQEMSQSVEQFQTQINESMEKAIEQSVIAEQKLEAMSLLEVQERLEQQSQENNQKNGQEGEQDVSIEATQSDEMVRQIQPVEIEPVGIGYH